MDRDAMERRSEQIAVTMATLASYIKQQGSAIRFLYVFAQFTCDNAFDHMSEYDKELVAKFKEVLDEIDKSVADTESSIEELIDLLKSAGGINAKPE